MDILINSARNGGHRNEDDCLVRVLSPMLTMVTAFVQMMDYRDYRLQKRIRELSLRESLDMFQLKQQVEGLHQNLAMYNFVRP